MSDIMLLISFLCVVIIALWSWSRRYPNAPPEFDGGLPIIGHAWKFFGNRQRLWDFIQELQNCSLEKGGVCETWFLNHSIYMVTDPEDSLTIANSCLSKPYVYGFAKDFIGNGLITAEADVWKSHRKLLNPAFSQQVLNTFVDEMNVQAKILVSELALQVGKGPFDVRKNIIKYILSTVTRTSLGLSTKEQHTINTDYAERTEDLLHLYCDRFQKVWLHVPLIFNWSSMKRRQTMLLKKLKDIIDPIIDERRSELKANKYQNIYDDESKSAKFKPILDRMLNLNEEQGVFTDEDIRQHLDTLVAAAYDTSSATMTFILLIIGSNPDLQERIFDELQEVLEDKDSDIMKHHLSKLVFLEAVIKETLRLYPVSPVIGRKLDKDINLKNCTLRAGNSCVIGVYGLLRHPMWGKDVNEFRPERWLDPSRLPDHPGLFASFGLGKRNCIGKAYGMMSLKIELAHILRRYRVTGDINSVVCEYSVSLKPVQGHQITLTLRS